MNIQISEKQLEKLKNTVQNLIDSEINEIRKESDEWGLSELDEWAEIESIDKITIDRIVPIVKFKVYVNIHILHQRFDFENILSEIQYRLTKFIPNIEIYLNEIIDDRSFGPGIDF